MGNLCAILLKKVKFKVKNQRHYRYVVIKSIRGSSPNNALSIHTTNSPSQSRETVPLNKFKFGKWQRSMGLFVLRKSIPELMSATKSPLFWQVWMIFVCP
jgi:hypothetical protein